MRLVSGCGDGLSTHFDPGPSIPEGISRGEGPAKKSILAALTASRHSRPPDEIEKISV
jgi:hypothetical protein